MTQEASGNGYERGVRMKQKSLQQTRKQKMEREECEKCADARE